MGSGGGLADLRALAEAATPGTWRADFITAANPTAVLALLDRVEAAEAAVERAKELVDEWALNGENPHTDDDMDIGWAADRVRAALEGR